MENNMQIDKELKERFEQFAYNVIQCNMLIANGQPTDYNQIMDLMALTAGQAIGIASYMGLNVSKPASHGSKSVGKPWVALGISRSTYYNDMRRAKLNDK
jgi:hypothetical protein